MFYVVNLFLFIFAVNPIRSEDLQINPGVVYLEDITFNKTVKKFPFAFVQFDDGSSVPSSKEKMFEFSKLATDFLSHNSDILAAQVRFRWGDVQMKRMANRFQV